MKFCHISLARIFPDKKLSVMKVFSVTKTLITTLIFTDSLISALDNDIPAVKTIDD